MLNKLDSIIIIIIIIITLARTAVSQHFSSVFLAFWCLFVRVPFVHGRVRSVTTFYGRN